MTETSDKPAPTEDAPEPTRPLTEAAKRALAEAEERREAARSASVPAEVGGRNGPDPVRYGDWEKDGIISDF
jgi:hypothetical protein